MLLCFLAAALFGYIAFKQARGSHTVTAVAAWALAVLFATSAAYAFAVALIPPVEHLAIPFGLACWVAGIAIAVRHRPDPVWMT